MLDFAKEHYDLIIGIVVFLTGWILPVPRFKAFGRQIGTQLPPKAVKLLSERLRAFERGLIQADVNGDINLVDNDTIKKDMKKVRLDLGLKE